MLLGLWYVSGFFMTKNVKLSVYINHELLICLLFFLLVVFLIFLLHYFQGSGWKVVASFEGNFPNRIKQLPLDRHFDLQNVKRVCSIFLKFWLTQVIVATIWWLWNWYQIVLEADGYQPYLISPEKGLRSLIKGVLELAKEPSRLCVDEVKMPIICHPFNC